MGEGHRETICNYCEMSNFAGTRFACLVCQDYEMCEDCWEQRYSFLPHKPYHPVQPILPEEFFACLDGSESDMCMFCCPYCGENQLTTSELIMHCENYHPDGGHPVRCPVCVVYQRTDVPFLTDNLCQHALEQHNEYCIQTDVPTNTQNTKECPICIEEMLPNCDIECLPCSHSYHSGCIEAWLQNRPTCPVCRVEVES